MPAKNKQQQAAAGAALAAERGEMAVSKLRPPARKMYESMTEDQIQKLATYGRSRRSGGSMPLEDANEVASIMRAAIATVPGSEWKAEFGQTPIVSVQSEGGDLFYVAIRFAGKPDKGIWEIHSKEAAETFNPFPKMLKETPPGEIK